MHCFAKENRKRCILVFFEVKAGRRGRRKYPLLGVLVRHPYSVISLRFARGGKASQADTGTG